MIEYKVKHVKSTYYDKLILKDALLVFDTKSELDNLQIGLSNGSTILLNNKKFKFSGNENDYNSLLPEFLCVDVNDSWIIQNVYTHWFVVRDKFVGVETENVYYFPDGTMILHPKKLSAEYLPEPGYSLDNKFQSLGCEYIQGIPFRQHYCFGRFNYYLERRKLTIQSSKVKQVFEGRQFDVVLQVMKFVEKKPLKTLERLLNDELEIT